MTPTLSYLRVGLFQLLAGSVANGLRDEVILAPARLDACSGEFVGGLGGRPRRGT